MANQATEDLCADIVQLYHPDLETTGATFDIVFALRDPESESDKPTLSVAGKRVYGISKPHGLKERVMGLKDAEILLDGDVWPEISADIKRALLDRHLQYFEVKRNKEGEFVMDDLNRPILTLRKPDRVYEWFDAVADRHRQNSIEGMEARNLFIQARQTYLPLALPDLEEPKSGKKILVRMNGGMEQEMTADQLTNSIAEKFQ